ncbi:MAG: spermidine synthase [Candidatus Micrarchaeia archaeon]
MTFLNIFKKRNFVIKSFGKKIEISEDEKYKTLKFNGVIQSRVNKKSVFSGEYWDLIPPVCYVFEKPNILMIGLGGGSIIKEISKIFTRANIDVVEINNEVISLYKNFFKDNEIEDSVKIYNKNGFDFVSSRKNTYDIIILDAYEIDNIPEEFLTEEFVKNSYRSLKENGILVINCIDSMIINNSLNNYLFKLDKLFSNYSLGSGFMTANKILLCFKNLDPDESFNRICEELSKNVSMRFLLNAYYSPVKEHSELNKVSK